MDTFLVEIYTPYLNANVSTMSVAPFPGSNSCKVGLNAFWQSKIAMGNPTFLSWQIFCINLIYSARSLNHSVVLIK